MKKQWRMILGIGISVFFLFFALKGLDLKEVRFWLSKADYYWLIPSILIYFVAVWGRTWRWHYMLRPIKVISLRRLFPITCIGYMGNNIFPARAGEILRAYVLKRTDQVSMSASLAPIIVERVFDGLVMLMFVFIGLPFVHIPGNLQVFVVAASVLFFAALVAFFVLALKPKFTMRLYAATLHRILPERFDAPLEGFLERFLTGLAFLGSGRDVIMVFVTSVFIWLMETLKYWFVMHAFVHLGGGFPVPFYVLMLMNGIVNLATTIPSAPGYIGTFDTPGVAVLAAYGVDKALAFGYTIVLHAALWFPITILGAWYFRRERLAWSDVETARSQRAGGLETT